MDILVVAGFAYLATIAVFVFGILSSALHLIFSGVRILRRRASGLNWIIALRWLSVAACLVWLLIAYLLGRLLHSVSATVGRESLTNLFDIIGLVPLMLLPVVLPLFEIWRYRRASSLTLAALSVIAFPVVIAATVTLIFSLAAQTGQSRPGGGVSLPGYENAALYHISPDPIKPRGQAIASWLGLPHLKSSKLDAGSSTDFEKQRAALWLDMALNDISFEWFSDAGWHFSELDFNTEDSALLAALPYLFRFAYEALFWAVAALLLQAFVRFVRETVRRHAADPEPEPETGPTG